MLSLAAGDCAGGDHEAGYASITQQAIVLAYHLLEHGSIDRDRLTADMAELGGGPGEPSVIRVPSDAFQGWLESASGGEPVLDSEPSLEPAARVAPVGIWFRRDPEAGVRAALDTSRLTHLDGPTAVAATATAGAVAAACFAQNGRDLLMAVADMAARAAERIVDEDFRYARVEALDQVVDQYRRAVSLVGQDPDRLSDELGEGPVARAVVAVTLAAPLDGRPDAVVRHAAEWGGSRVGALVGAVVGARAGVRSWPWTVPNETWFVAMGQRLAAGRRGLDELPVPYAVEQRVGYAGDPRRI